MGDKYNPQKIWNFDLGTLIRDEDLNGRHYVVVPMTMILEGVHTGSQGPVYYSIDELAKTPKQWNMKPIVIEHPFRGDTATDLEVYKKQAVGMIMNTHFVDGKLKAEAWIDKELAQEKCPEVLMHIEHKLPMEISTGLFSELVLDEGVWNGEPYKGRIVNIRADHLAILPNKQGACSLSDGAGLLINQKKQAKDTLNIITTTINQEYPAGSLVIADEDDEQHNENDAKLRTKTQEEPEEAKTDKPIEDAFQTQVFTTADGYKITVEPPKNKSLKIPDVDFASGVEDDELVDDDDEDDEQVTVPLQDNATVIDEDEQEDGIPEFIESIRKLTNVLKDYNYRRKTKRRAVRNDSGNSVDDTDTLFDAANAIVGDPDGLDEQGTIAAVTRQSKKDDSRANRNRFKLDKDGKIVPNSLVRDNLEGKNVDAQGKGSNSPESNAHLKTLRAASCLLSAVKRMIEESKGNMSGFVGAKGENQYEAAYDPATGRYTVPSYPIVSTESDKENVGKTEKQVFDKIDTGFQNLIDFLIAEALSNFEQSCRDWKRSVRSNGTNRNWGTLKEGGSLTDKSNDDIAQRIREIEDLKDKGEDLKLELKNLYTETQNRHNFLTRYVDGRKQILGYKKVLEDLLKKSGHTDGKVSDTSKLQFLEDAWEELRDHIYQFRRATGRTSSENRNRLLPLIKALIGGSLGMDIFRAGGVESGKFKPGSKSFYSKFVKAKGTGANKALGPDLHGSAVNTTFDVGAINDFLQMSTRLLDNFKRFDAVRKTLQERGEWPIVDDAYLKDPKARKAYQDLIHSNLPTYGSKGMVWDNGALDNQNKPIFENPEFANVSMADMKSMVGELQTVPSPEDFTPEAVRAVSLLLQLLKNPDALKDFANRREDLYIRMGWSDAEARKMAIQDCRNFVTRYKKAAGKLDPTLSSVASYQGDFGSEEKIDVLSMMSTLIDQLNSDKNRQKHIRGENIGDVVGNAMRQFSLALMLQRLGIPLDQEIVDTIKKTDARV